MNASTQQRSKTMTAKDIKAQIRTTTAERDAARMAEDWDTARRLDAAVSRLSREHSQAQRQELSSAAAERRATGSTPPGFTVSRDAVGSTGQRWDEETA